MELQMEHIHLSGHARYIREEICTLLTFSSLYLSDFIRKSFRVVGTKTVLESAIIISKAEHYLPNIISIIRL